MGVWIRSQNRELLLEIAKIETDVGYQGTTITGHAINGKGEQIGFYKNRERALEILDEIEKTIKGKVILKYNYVLAKKDLEKLKRENQEFLVTDNRADIIPIPQNNIIYEMPKE